MYTVHKNAQIILALLKEFGIKNLVISAGTRHIPVVFSAEDDGFFNCYSIVDERSAGFFALGLIQATKEPACIICTSGTATCNYVSAVNEAYYQHLPLVVLTSDRNRAYLNQLEGQCLPQVNLFRDVIRKVVDLPIVRDDLDFWYCSRLVNEALLELDHREKGPVHINFQIDDNYPISLGTFKFEIENLPKVQRIRRVMAYDNSNCWEALAKELKGKRTMISYGQNTPISEEEENAIQYFCEHFNAVVLANNISNIHTKNTVNNIQLTNTMGMQDWQDMRPDIVITIHGNEPVLTKARIAKWPETVHWHISADGAVADPYKKLSQIIECPSSYFFNRMNTLSGGICNEYGEAWAALASERVNVDVLSVELNYSAVYAVQGLVKRMPKNSLFHIANSNSIRIAELLPIPDSTVRYCNRGTCGIDGSMSSYIAQSYISDRPSFLIIGDLSFFYDMNALWNRYCTRNTRIMLCNNSGGALFHSGYYKQVKVFDNIDRHIAAEHHSSAEGWAKSQGFKYLVAHNQDEYLACIEEFTNCKNEKPLLFEVFTDKEIDQTEKSRLAQCAKSQTGKALHSIKNAMPKSVVSIFEKFRK